MSIEEDIDLAFDIILETMFFVVVFFLWIVFSPFWLIGRVLRYFNLRR
jgi:hypothetical protein